MRLNELDYHLPADHIAQFPPATRGDSRLLCLDRAVGTLSDELFPNLPLLLRGDELLVLNNARVIPARLLGRRISKNADSSDVRIVSAGGPPDTEIFLVRKIPGQENVWQSLVRPGRKMQVGAKVFLGSGELEAEVMAQEQHGIRLVRFVSRDGLPVQGHLQRLGHMPLPPYIERQDDGADRERYQTVFAKHPGAVAAPTAGLHFTMEMFEKLRQRRIETCELTLDVGLGTFQPVRAENLEDHAIHSESYEIPVETAEKINAARNTGRSILAIGTTVVRALEDSALRASETGSKTLVLPGRREARLFIVPGFRFRVVNALLTNFHLPRSTLLALVCAFGGRDRVMAAYHHAVATGYRFYSYGDCMLMR
jgi:S-adenosylmethionine:tRNA ribosyltransferase-isomerase